MPGGFKFTKLISYCFTYACVHITVYTENVPRIQILNRLINKLVSEHTKNKKKQKQNNMLKFIITYTAQEVEAVITNTKSSKSIEFDGQRPAGTTLGSFTITFITQFHNLALRPLLKNYAYNHHLQTHIPRYSNTSTF